MKLIAFSFIGMSLSCAAMPATDPNPSGRFDTAKGAHTFVNAEALLFQLTQDSHPVAELTDVPVAPPYDLEGKVFTDYLYHYKQPWRWGFRVTAGYHLPHDGWDLVANYMRFYCYNDQSFFNHLGPNYRLSSGLKPILSLNSAVLFRWSVRFNQWDLEQDRTFYVSKYLRLTPILGLRNLILGQSFTTRVSKEISPGNYTSKNDMHFWGMGVLAGLKSLWQLNRQFSLYGGAKLASLFGHYHTQLYDGITRSPALINLATNTEKSSKTCLDLSIGAQWDKYFYQDKLHLGVNVGFEQHIYFNMNKSIFGWDEAQLFEGVSGRDFSMQGFCFGLRADF